MPSSCRFHHTMVSVMRSTLSVMCMILFQRSQRSTSSSMSIMTRRFSDILQDSTPRCLKTSIAVSSSPSTLLTTPSPSSSQHRRTPVLLRDLSWREESTRMSIRATISSYHRTSQLVETSESMVTTSISSVATSTQPSTSPLTPETD